MSVLQFADKIITSRSNVYNIFKAKHIPLNRLEIYSKALNKNLVQLIADKMEEELEKLSQGNPEEFVFVSGRMLKRKKIKEMLSASEYKEN